MTRSHRAGGPEYNPNTGMRVNQEHTSHPLERVLRDTPRDEHVEGVNFPYRGLEQHGVEYAEEIPEELEGTPSKKDLDLVLPPHYAPRPHHPEPVPVKIVTGADSELRMFQTDQFTINDGTVNGPLMIMGRQLNRHHFVIRNMDAANNVYIGNSASVTPNTGFQIAPNTTFVKMETTQAVYAVTESTKTAQISIMWEYSVGI
ncbi:MAG TPA: hypothetical protein VGE93_06500 [Bryobacteraceae bacterium]